MLDYHLLNYLSENIYAMYDSYDEDDINYEISSFFMNLMNRRRSDNVEEGLQAGGVIYPDRAGFKISERNGSASHAQSQENVSQYLNGENAYSSEEAVGMVGTRRNDPNLWANITKKGFTVRLVANRNAIVCIFHTNTYQVNEFQLDVIYELFSHIKKAYEDGVIKTIYVNYITGRDKFVFREFLEIDEQLDNLEKLLVSRKDAVIKKTR